MLATLCIGVTGTVSAYVFIFFMPIFAKRHLGMPVADVNLITFIGTAVLLVCCPLAGHLSDKYGRKAVLLPGIVAYGIVGYFLFHHFVMAPSFASLLLAQVVISFFMSFIWGPTPRSEEHTSELQSLMRNSYAVFCLKKKKNNSKYI